MVLATRTFSLDGALVHLREVLGNGAVEHVKIMLGCRFHQQIFLYHPDLVALIESDMDALDVAELSVILRKRIRLMCVRDTSSSM
jgi:hypothetical protein